MNIEPNDNRCSGKKCDTLARRNKGKRSLEALPHLDVASSICGYCQEKTKEVQRHACATHDPATPASAKPWSFKNQRIRSEKGFGFTEDSMPR